MKIRKNKKIITLLCCMLAVLIVLAAAAVKQSKRNIYGSEADTAITESMLPKVSEVLRQAELSNVDLFETWVYEFHENKNTTASAYSDSDCRMTAMLLADDQISCNDAEEYTGDYLMIDVDKIKNEEAYLFIRDNLNVFTTLFGETEIPKSGIKDALPENWKKHGIKFYNDTCSLVSVVIKSIDRDEAFVGHTGILIDCSDMQDVYVKTKYLFVEKLAFNEAFHATQIEKPEELLELFDSREEYKAEGNEPNTVVYLNDEYLGELK